MQAAGVRAAPCTRRLQQCPHAPLTAAALHATHASGPPGGLLQQPAPFATASQPDEGRYPADMHLVHKGKQEVTGKVRDCWRGCSS